MSGNTLATTTGAERRYDLDWLRVGAFALLIFYHIGMFYVTWDWHVKSPHADDWLEPLMRLINPWRLALLFFISGVALRFAMDKTQMRGFLPKRSLRLFIPIVFGMAVICAPQAYYELLHKGETAPGFWAFWVQYLDFDMEFSILTPTWNHLWYVVYIFTYTLVIAASLPLLRRLIGPAARLFGWMAERRGGWPVLILPVVPFIAIDAWLGDTFPTTHAFYDDWANHAQSFFLVLSGWLAAKSPAFWRGVERAVPLTVAAALTLGVGLTLWRFAGMSAGGLGGEVIEAGRMLYAWAVILGLLGLAQRYLNRPHPALSYLTEAIFPYYILHQTLIVCFAAWATEAGLPLWGEVAFVVSGTVLGCVLGYELIIRPVPILRPLFGLSWRDRIGEILPKRTAMLQAP